MSSTERLISTFDEATKRPAGPERERFLVEACQGDSELNEQVRSLLKSDAGARGFLEGTVFSATGPVTEQLGDAIGAYKLLEKLGEGGCGVVYAAEQTQPVRRRVAVKVIKLGMETKQVVARFEAERQALAMMDHANIAKVLDVGSTETGRPYFVMELVRGIKITDYCDQHQLSVKQRLDLFITVCQAIQHAHQKGVIHRDIKPSNILVTLHDGAAVPKVIDFGIAKATEGRLADGTIYTQLLQFIGTPAYMSPEQADLSGPDVDTRTDIYSLGVLLYELLTGKTPFDGDKLMASGLDAMRKTIREKEPVRPSAKVRQHLAAGDLRLAPDSSIRPQAFVIHSDLDWIVMKCLEKDRSRRYDTAHGLEADVRRHLTNEPVVARPPTSAYRFQKAWRRNKLAFSAAAAVGGALLIGMVLALWQAGVARATAEKLEANLYLTRLAAAHHQSTAQPPGIQQAEDLLNACKPEMRDWEWRYLKRLRLVDPFELHDPGQEGVNSLSFSSDGRSVVSAGADGSVRIWDVDNRLGIPPQSPRQTIVAHAGFAFCSIYHPTDATRIVSAGSDNRVKLWDLKSGALLKSWPCTFSFEWGLAYAVAFSPDGGRLAFSSEGGGVKICSSTTFDDILTLRFESPRPLFSLAFSPDGRRLATGHGDGFVRLWDLQSGRCLSTLGEIGPPIGCVAFSQKGDERLAAASFDGSVHVWSTENPNATHSRFRAHNGFVVGLAFSAESRRFATAGHDRTIKLWSVDTGEEMLTFRGFAKQTSVAFSADGNRLAASSMDGTIRLWDASPIKPDEDKGRLTLLHPLQVSAMDVSPEGDRIASGVGLPQPPDTASVFIWDTASGLMLKELPGQAVIVFSVAFSPDGKFIASVGDDQDRPPGFNTVKVWNVETGWDAFDTEPFLGFGGVLFCVAYSPDGRHMVAAGQDKKLKVWDAATGRRIGVLGEHDRNVFNLVFSPNGRYLASAGKDGAVSIWDGRALDQEQNDPRKVGRAGGDIADTLAFSPDSTLLAIGSSDLTATVWNVEAGTAVLSLNRNVAHGFRALAFSPDGRWLASGGTDCTVKVWDARTGALLHTFHGHKGNVTRLKFVRRAHAMQLISASLDHSVKFWDLSLLENR